MKTSRSARVLAPLTTLAIVVLALTGCGGGSTGSDGSASGGSVDTAKIDEILKPYTTTPDAFPITDALEKKPENATIAYLQCATPYCAIFADLLAPAAEKLGVNFTVTKADASASSIQRAAETILAQKPSALVVGAIDPSIIKNELAEFDAAGIPVLANGLIDAADYGIDVAFNDSPADTIYGQVLAAWAVKERGADTNVVFYNIPELTFSPIIRDAFVSTVGELCPSCTVRTKDISVTSIGSTAPQEVVSDLQANPDTNAAVFASEEAATGLPAALKVAGLDSQVLVNGFGATPAQLQEIADGDLAGSVAVDVPIMMWMVVDAAARLITGQELAPIEKSGIPPAALVAAGDLEGKDISNGYSVYPDYQDEFAKLWANAAS
ncbi:sugar ABC transporter substrate-binding protein [Microbacterium sp. NPDC091313]